MFEQELKVLQELLALQTANVTESAKRQAREKIIEFFTMKNDLNWQDVATPYDIVREMLDLFPSDAENFIVFFSMEFLEELVKARGVAPEKIIFVGDNIMETTFAAHPHMYGVKSVVMSKENGYQNGKLNFPQEIFNFNNEVNMKFGKVAVIGNPPYNSNSNGKDSIPLYHIFVEAVIDNLNPDFFSFIIPSRWMVGGKGLDKHRERMMNDTHMKKIVHFGGSKDVFSTLDGGVKGGVNYFLWEKSYNGECEFVTGNTISRRYLNKYDIIIQDNNALSVLEKVLASTSNWISNMCLPRKPFGIRSDFSNWSTNGIKCYSAKKIENTIDPNEFTDKSNVLGKWKVCTSKGINPNKDGNFEVYNNLFVIEPNAICTETYLVVNAFNTYKEAENFISYMKSRFFRFMLGLRVSTQNMCMDSFAWTPDPIDYSAPWTDAELYKKYNLTRQEVAYIESKIKAI